MHRLLIALVLVIAIPLEAGVIYHFRTSTTGPRGGQTQSGRMWVDGQRYRLELDRDGKQLAYDAAISNDGDVTAKLLNRQKETWWHRIRVSSATRSSLLFTVPALKVTLEGEPQVTHRVAGTETVAGRRTTKHVVEIRYELRTELEKQPIRATVEAAITAWIADDLPPLPLQRNVQTGYAPVDEKLAAIFGALPGMTLRHELTVVRTYEGGPPVTEIITTVIDELRVADVPAERFAVPEHYKFAPPPGFL